MEEGWGIYTQNEKDIGVGLGDIHVDFEIEDRRSFWKRLIALFK